tara:strand:+ start:43 stop:1275 length:1233 start_codon:yes stop_codon:yes gene_type:complete
MNPLSGKTIFVQIAAYRDSQLRSTLEDMISKAHEPENLKICICWQHSPDDEWDHLNLYTDDDRFIIIDVDANDSKGACWARNLIQQEYSGEDFTLQLDAHHRFVKGWDTELKNQVLQLQLHGYEKPLITGYMTSFHPSLPENEWAKEPWQMRLDRFTPDGVLFFKPDIIPNWEERTMPVPARFYSAHFCFTLGIFCEEVPHDPRYYFHGEEITIGVRAYTYGYDLFHSHKLICYHEFSRDYRLNNHWDNYSEFDKHNQETYKLMRGLLGIDGESLSKKETYGTYGLGDVRTIAEWEQYAGVRFIDRSVKQPTIDGDLPPVDPELPFNRVFKHVLSLHKDTLKDINFVAVILKDKDGIDLFRKDYSAEEVSQLTNGTTVNLWIEAIVVSQPAEWIVWPNDGEWLERTGGTL